MVVDRITELTAATTVDQDNDLVVFVDVSDITQNASGTTKKVTPKLLNGNKDLPAGDYVGTMDTQTLTNKTLTSPKVNENVALTSTATELNQLDGVEVGGVASGDIITTDDTQTLTNKTIDADNNTVSNLAHGAEVDNPSSGVHGVTGDIVGTTDTQTLTSKTLTSPKVNLTTNVLSGYSLALSDDTATSFTPSKDRLYVIVHSINGAGNYGTAELWCVDGAVVGTKISGSATFEVTTGALAGTTGTDGKFTLSAHSDGKIYVENRLNSSRTFSLILLS